MRMSMHTIFVFIFHKQKILGLVPSVKLYHADSQTSLRIFERFIGKYCLEEAEDGTVGLQLYHNIACKF